MTITLLLCIYLANGLRFDRRFHYALGINRNNLFNNRLQNELVQFRKNPPPQCKLDVYGSNNNIWIVTWTGLPKTIYEGEVYRLKIIFPKEYPLKPPIIYFLQPAPVHAHVYSNGDICMSSLGTDYLPTASVYSFVISIISMLSSANEKRLPIDNHLHADLPPGSTDPPLCNSIPINHVYDKTIASLEYLGCGYDALSDNKTEGDYGIDMNYKGPVIKFNWVNDINNLNNTLEWEHPTGTFIWNYPNCSIIEETTSSEALDDVNKLITTDITIDVIKLNGDLRHKKGKTSNDSSSNLVKASYCTKYISGTIFNNNSELTDPFQKSINHIQHVVIREKKRGCTINKYNKHICKRVIDAWNDFINNFGTHVVTKIILGGKIYSSKKIKSNSLTSENSTNGNLHINKGINLNAGSKNMSGYLNDSEYTDFTSTISGGVMNNKDGYNSAWSNSIEGSPVPLKITLTSYKDLFERLNIFKSYKRALSIKFRSKSVQV